MANADDQTIKKLLALRLVLAAVGLLFIFGVYPLAKYWPAGWSWAQGPSPYFAMIVGIYVTLGIFLLFAARDPLAHRSVIWFTVWSSLVHSGIMAAQAISQPEMRDHLLGDVPALFVVAAVLAWLMPRRNQE
ncbi:MAG: DUF6632 domain-containing protein [Candidatus Eiseniibacteriota bacterium]